MVFDDKTGLFYFLAETLFDVGCFFEVEVKLLRLKLIIFVVKGDFFKIKVTFFTTYRPTLSIIFARALFDWFRGTQ